LYIQYINIRVYTCSKGSRNHYRKYYIY